MIFGKTIFDSEEVDTEVYDFDEDLKNLFDNTDENNTYVLVGSCGCHDGPHNYVIGTFNSVYEAIKGTYLRSESEFKVVAYPYGVLHVETIHHDGVNDFEIRQLSNKGYEMHQNWWTLNEIVKRNGTTKNAHFKIGGK